MRSLFAGALYGVVLLVATAGTFAPTLFEGQLQTDPGDTLLNHYILEHGWRCVSDPGYCGTFWSPPCFYPEKNTLAYSENMLGVGPYYWAARLFLDADAAYAVWMIFVAGLTYVSAVWTFRKFDVPPLLAAAGAVAWAYGLPRINQLGHQQLLGAMYAPPALWYASEFCRRPALGSFVAVTGLVGLQILSSIYIGWFLAFAIGVMIAISLCSAGATNRLVEFVRADAWRLAAVATLAGAAAYVLLHPYLEANQGFRRSFRHEVRLMLPRFDSMLSPPPSSIWTTVLPPTDGPLNHEHHIFPGAGLYLLCVVVAVVGLYRCSAIPPAPFLLLMTAAGLMLLSLRFGKISAWSVVFQTVPGAKAIRAVTRIVTIAHLAAWLGVLCTISCWLRARPRLPTAVGAILLVGSVADQYQPRLPGFDQRPFRAEVSRLTEELRNGPPAYVEPDAGSPFWVSHIAAMWAGLKANVPVVNGYSGRTPPGFPDEKLIWDDDELARWTDGVRRIPAVRLAAAYPAPPAPPDRPELDFRPRRIERDPSCRISPTKHSPPAEPARPDR
ncbi:MAG: hypothetical protein K1X57_00280 [Gemmataceae bacterium]|nr:hypothetical protein [Gemmataceae bacterium]